MSDVDSGPHPRYGRRFVAATSLAAAALTLHSAWNLRHLRRAPTQPPDPLAEPHRPIAALLPARDEAHRIEPCLRALLAQDHPWTTILILDDGSSDGTAELVREVVGDDPRVRVLAGGDAPPPPGWLGKPWACHRLAQAAMALPDAPALLVFLDADVVLAAPEALRRIDALMRTSRLDLASPYPRQLAVTPAERLVQPLLQWSWLTTLPLPLAESSPRPSLTAANGQLLAITPTAYRRSGGHAAARHEVIEDIALARRVKATGGRAGMTDGTDLATCRMYTSTGELVDGYAKSLWAAFGSPAGALGTTAALTAIYVAPPIAALAAPTRTTRAICAAGYLAAVAGRVLVARRTGGRAGDALAHPVSILALDALTALSFRRRRQGALQWKGRPVDVTHSERS